MSSPAIPVNVPHDLIYRDHCGSYDRLRSCMDHEGNLLKNIQKIINPTGKQIVELAAGTGRLTHLLAPLAAEIRAFDLAPDMISYARKKSGTYPHIYFEVADSYAIPLPDASASIVIEGWSLGYIAFAAGNNWQTGIDLVIAEMERLLQPGGSILLFGTLGTGVHCPAAPNKVLADLYVYLTEEKGFTQSEWFPTDYRFADLDEAVALTTFFWSEKFGSYVREHELTIVPECTAIWYKTLPLT